ncbi:MAG TPA: VOC family protein [Gaiellaceae bacterium]|jgi:lactoylglutathione lyase
MRATRFNHVSIPCRDLDESERFYRDAFGLDRLPSFEFRFPVRYLGVGEQQLHLMQLPDEQPLANQHFAVDVDDFEAAFVRLRDLGALDLRAHAHPVWQLPDGSVQLYARDPAGNLLEVNWPDASTLDREVVGEIPRRADDVEQGEEALGATLYHARV